MQPLVRVEIHTEDDCILFQAKKPNPALEKDIINAVALAFENFYQKNFQKYKMITTESGGMILEPIV